MKIGIVLAGGMNNGIYEIGCIKAIADQFPAEDIACISASSIGALVAYSFACGRLELMVKTLKELDVSEAGTFFPSFCRNKELLTKIQNMACDGMDLICPTYATVWNYSGRKIEYVPFHTLPSKDAAHFLCASVAVPVVGKGVRIRGDLHFDGAFVDNIPVYPLLEQSIDLIFCVYFENRNYYFENDAFNQKVVKLCDFPRPKRYDTFVFDPERIDSMIDYAYRYTQEAIRQIVAADTADERFECIRRHNEKSESNIKYRITCDSILANLNKVTRQFANRRLM